MSSNAPPIPEWGAELIHKLLLSKDADALEKLESLSLEVKKAHFDAKQPGSKVGASNASPFLVTLIA